jgi:hypothetical protein
VDQHGEHLVGAFQVQLALDFKPAYVLQRNVQAVRRSCFVYIGPLKGNLNFFRCHSFITRLLLLILELRGRSGTKELSGHKLRLVNVVKRLAWENVGIKVRPHGDKSRLGKEGFRVEVVDETNLEIVNILLRVPSRLENRPQSMHTSVIKFLLLCKINFVDALLL